MDELEKYYQYLKGAKADVPPTFESFKTTLSDDKTSRQYYQYLRDNKFDTPDNYDSFSNTFGLKKKATSSVSVLRGNIGRQFLSRSGSTIWIWWLSHDHFASLSAFD